MLTSWQFEWQQQDSIEQPKRYNQNKTVQSQSEWLVKLQVTKANKPARKHETMYTVWCTYHASQKKIIIQ